MSVCFFFGDAKSYPSSFGVSVFSSLIQEQAHNGTVDESVQEAFEGSTEGKVQMLFECYCFTVSSTTFENSELI